MEKATPQDPEQLAEAARLNELRRLLIGLSQEELRRLQLLLSDPHEFAEELSQLLPYAIRKMIEKGEITVDNLLPFVEDAMHKSIQKNPQRLADILFPVMGPAIRKAVSEDLKRMIAAINASLESGLSPKTLKWRLQAMTSKRSFAEIVLANSYVYHVSHVFLIHRETGLLLHEEQAAESKSLEADLISSMLTAIRDFAQDSFKQATPGTLDEIQVGELKILVEQGPYAVLAAIIEGQPPADFRLTLMETIEAVHYNHVVDLEKFNGDTAVFRHTAKFLQQCLIKAKKTSTHKPPYVLMVFLFLGMAGLGYLLIQRYQHTKRLKSFASALESQAGYHLTNSEVKGRTIYISGLKDPLAAGPDSIREAMNIENRDLKMHFDAYVSADPTILLKRARVFLNPPSGVNLSLSGQTLIVSGKADVAWVQQLRQLAALPDGIEAVDDTGLNQLTSDLTWIIPAIEEKSFGFDVNVIKLDNQQQIVFDSLVRAALELENYNQIYHKTLAIYVRSYTKRSNNALANEKVARQRAEEFISLLERAGVKKDLLKSQVLFAEDLNENVSLRTVHFAVFDKNQSGND